MRTVLKGFERDGRGRRTGQPWNQAVAGIGRLLLWGCVGVFSCVSVVAAAGGDSVAVETGTAVPGPVETGLAALRESRHDEARKVFLQNFEVAENSGQRAKLGEAHFYLGLTDQQEAQEVTESSQREALLKSALSRYGKALELGLPAGGVLNNLARVQAGLGRTNDALASLSRAMELGDGRRGFYAENYANLLLETGRWRDACRVYALVAGEQPRNAAVHRKLVDLCVRNGPDLLAWYLWELARQGQVVQVLDHALGVMDNPVWTRPQREELMGLVAYCLSQKNEPAEEFLESPSGQRLRLLGRDPVVGRGVLELLQLFEGAPAEGTRFPWWARLIEPGTDARRGMWPFEAFTWLARSLSDRAAGEGDPTRQEKYLLLAVGARPGSPDPEALLGLANLYAERRETNKLDAMMRRYEVSIFEGKGQAYSSAQTEKIYRYHMALGVIYSQLDRWKSPGQIDSAMFQLERALSTADRLNANRLPGEAGASLSSVNVPTRLVDLLADGYEKTGQAEDAVRVRFDRAEKYLDLGQSEAATRVMAPVRARYVDPPKGGAPTPALDRRLQGRWKQIDERIQRTPQRVVSPSAGRVQIQVAPEAWTVAGGSDRPTLGAAERRALESELGGIVPGLDAKAGNRKSGAAYRSLGANALGSNIEKVTVSGGQGNAVIRRGTNLVNVPFKVEGTTNSARRSRPRIQP